MSPALGAYGAGSVPVAVVLPRVLSRVPHRAAMVAGAFALVPVFVLLAAGAGMTVTATVTGGPAPAAAITALRGAGPGPAARRTGRRRAPNPARRVSRPRTDQDA
ncbi:hypothetical protein ACFYSC_30405 [Streptosporangium sp. NPDC004379]|uniref:hypothetical protein n=1 Tax=Streptosporangium sp. NPDC004379 TaxID=3366189 RepID=UPI0036B888E4